MTAKMTVQQLADARLAPEYQQPVKTLSDAMAAIGWPSVDKPECCGKPVEVRSLIGPYAAICNECGKFVFDVTGPEFGPNGNYVQFPDGDSIDMDTEVRWVSGQRAAPQFSGDEVTT